MSNDKTVTMPLELAEYFLHCGDINSSIAPAMTAQLRSLLAAPTVERQAEPIYQVLYNGDGGGGWVDVEKVELEIRKNNGNYHTRTVFDSPPAPASTRSRS